MTTIDLSNIDFDLESIFPRCIKEYNDVRREIALIDMNEFYNVCNRITNTIGAFNSGYSFRNTCIYLSTYLKHIENKSEEEKIPYCKYFYFKLKDEIYYLKPTCQNEIDCYKVMTSSIDLTTGETKVPNICNGHIKVLDDVTFSLFQMLEDLYYNSHELLKNGEQCPLERNCFINYKKLCDICQKDNNEGLRTFLKKFKDEHLKNVDAPSCIQSPKFLHSPRGTSIRTVLLTSFIITLAIPFIVFILYEYTPCGLYLQQTIRKFKEILNKKRKEEQQLVNSFESTYDELVNKWSQISYSAIN